LGSHDSFAISADPWALGRNQEIDLLQQLELGVRMLQVQAHMKDDELRFCHTSCLLFDGGTIEGYLTKVKSFLDRNPNEVITIIIANPEDIAPAVFEDVFEKSQMAGLAYTTPHSPMKRDDWPTLGEMITSGKRVVVFMDKGFEPKHSSASTSLTTRRPPETGYIIPQFQAMWEDPYDPDNSDFACRVDRTQGPLAPNQQLNLINHNLNINLFGIIGRGLRIPNRSNAPVTNRISSITEHAENCAPFADEKKPNFVLLDWVDIGQGARAVELLNGFN
jgi:hypothetical protein